MSTSYAIDKNALETAINYQRYFGNLFNGNELKDIECKLIPQFHCVTTLLAMYNCDRNDLGFIIH